MFFSLLAVSEQTTKIVNWVSLGVIAAVIVLIVVLSVFNKKYTSNDVAFAGICLAASFALSFIKVTPVQYGGSITLASFVPVLIYAYKFGVIRGLLAGIVLGLFNFISGPYILTPLTFFLDYILAFASIALMGFAPKFGKMPATAKLVLGTVLVYVVRFIFHLLSGFIYFAENSIWVDLPQDNMFVYSFIYQCVYLPADCAIAAIVLAVLSKTGAFDRLIAIMDKKKGAAPATPAAEEKTDVTAPTEEK